MKRIIFFTKGMTPTTAEKAELAKLNTAAEKPYEVLVFDRTRRQDIPLRATDFVAGTPPTEYASTPVVDPDNVPVTLPATKAVVTNGVALTVPVTGTFVSKATHTVVNGVVTGIVLS